MKPIPQKYCHGWILTQNTTSTEDFCWNSGNEKKKLCIRIRSHSNQHLEVASCHVAILRKASYGNKWMNS